MDINSIIAAHAQAVRLLDIAPEQMHEVEIRAFPQGWSSTALGFGGVGGQAMTSAVTTIVSHIARFAVFFGSRHAYTIDNPNLTFWEDIQKERMAAVYQHGRYIRKPTVATPEE